MVNRIFFITVFSIFVGSLYSSEVSIDIYPSKSTVGLGEYFQISVEIKNADGNVSFQGVEDLSDFVKISKSGNMSSFSLVNGQMTSSQTIMFTVQISKEGKYDVGPFVFNIGGRTYKTAVIPIEVTADSYNRTSPVNGDPDSGDSEVKNVNDFKDYTTTSDNNLNYLIKVEFSKKEAYIDEYIDANVKFYARDELQVINYEPLKFPPQAWAENFELKNNYVGKTKINNLVYQEYLIEKKRFYISKEGIFEIMPAILNFNGLSGRGFFAYPEKMSLATKKEVITVKPFPSTQHTGFYGLVGDFTYESSLSSSNIKVKDPATLIITVSGNGNMQNIKDIKYTISGIGIEQYSSKSNVTESGNKKVKTWEILFVAQKGGKYKIDLEDFVFFDPQTSQYRIIKGKSYTLSVVDSDIQNDDSSMIIHSDNKDGAKDAFIDISYLKLNIGKKSGILNYDLFLKIIIVFYSLLIIIISLFLVVRYSNFNSFKNSSLIKMKHAYKNFTQRIDKLKKELNRGFDDKIIDRISNITENYFIDKFEIDSIEFTKSAIREKLNKFLTGIQIDKLIDVFSNMDFIRFGGTTINKETILELIRNVTLLIREIEGANK